MNDTQIFIENMELCRKIWRKDQREMAALLGVTYDIYSNLLNGRKKPDIPTLLKMEQMTGIVAFRLYTEKIGRLEIADRPRQINPYPQKMDNEDTGAVKESESEYESFAVTIMKRLDKIEERIGRLEKGTL